MKRIALLIFAFAGIALIAIRVNIHFGEEERYVPKALGEMSLHDLAGKTWTLADFQGKTTFVNVWATWCSPCRYELPKLQKLYELATNQKDIQVITMNVDEDPGRVRSFLAANHYNFPVLISASDYAKSETRGLFGSFDIPQNWLVDRAGNVREKKTGYELWDDDWPGKMLKKLTAMAL